jgi:hypothetical protein
MNATDKQWTITVRQGYSGVDHLAGEVIYWAEQRMEGIEYRSAAAAKRGAWAALRWALKNKYVNSSKTYSQMGLTTLSYCVA